MSAHTVFVYGTLRKGGSNHFRMDGAEFVGKGTVGGGIYLIDSNPELIFPALKLDNEGRVVGEVYRVSETQLIALDAFEGISERYEEPYEYRREMVTVEMDAGDPVNAWVWVWNSCLDGAKPLPEGDWLLYEPNPG
jgi:gamma-glutamylcyclotransferase (GGCT)/AIG2-like uncharacterized protein YtfP